MALCKQSKWRQRLRYCIVERDDQLYLSGLWWLLQAVFLLIFTIAIFITFPPIRIPPYTEFWRRWLMPFLVWGLFAWLIQFLIPAGKHGPYLMGRFGRPLVRINQDTLTLALARMEPQEVKHWQPQVELALPTLRAVTVKVKVASVTAKGGWRRRAEITRIYLKLTDGTTTTVSMRHEPYINAAITDFLRRKLPASVELTVDEKAVYFGRGGL